MPANHILYASLQWAFESTLSIPWLTPSLGLSDRCQWISEGILSILHSVIQILQHLLSCISYSCLGLGDMKEIYFMIFIKNIFSSIDMYHNIWLCMQCHINVHGIKLHGKL